MTALVERKAAPAAPVEREAPPATWVEREAPLASLVEREAPPATWVEREAPLANLVEREAPLAALVEREAPLASLLEAHAQVVHQRQGRCVLVHGEAGIGKSSLIEAFLGQLSEASSAPGAPVLTAGCEPLFTPRPLGPLVDLSDRLPPAIAAALHEGRNWSGLFPAMLAHLRATGPGTVLVIEDLHWADTATLDFVRFLGRRLRDAAVLAVLSLRSDEPQSADALRHAVGELPAATTARLALQPLSPQAVATLAARRGRSARGLHAITGGLPFHVVETLAAAPGQQLPPSVAEAVLLRVSRLPPAARAVVEGISLFPGSAERAVLRAIVPDDSDAIDTCVRHGLLAVDGQRLTFRHELAREAVRQSLAPARRMAWHGAIYEALVQAADGGADDDDALARLLHHAEGAGLDEPVARHAPRAARHSTRHGAHREAARLYGLALRHSADAPALKRPTRRANSLVAAADAVDADGTRAMLLAARAQACALSGQFGEAIGALREALALHRTRGDTAREGVTLHWLARLHGWSDSLDTALECARQSIERLEPPSIPQELAVARATLAQLQLAAGEIDAAAVSGQAAVELAERIGHAAALSQGLGVTGSARLRRADDPAGWLMLERSLAVATEAGLDGEAGLAHSLLHAMSLLHRRYSRALVDVERAIAFCEARGLDVFSERLRIRRAFALMQTGRWSITRDELAGLRARPPASALERGTLDFVAAVFDLRRGAADGQRRLDAACRAFQGYGDRVWFTSLAAARAEAAWLADDDDAVQAAAAPALALAVAARDPWRAMELAGWLARAGRAPALLEWGPCGGVIDAPQQLEVDGQSRAAAEAWRRLGCPYEEAMALTIGNDPLLLDQALARFERLGAGPAAARVRRRLLASTPRGGPQPRTRDDPLGLTVRERQVFERLLRGESNATMARALCRSTRTIEHHVAAVFAKTSVRSRAELIARHK
jgi:DNA-binding CsgD family transcriptional regulator